MHAAERNVGTLVFGEHEHLVVAGDPRRTADHDPVFGAVVVHLQAERGTGFDHDAFDLEARAGVDRIIIAPGPEHLPVPGRLRTLFGFQTRHDVFHFLHAVLVRDQYGVVGVDHHDVLSKCGLRPMAQE